MGIKQPVHVVIGQYNPTKMDVSNLCVPVILVQMACHTGHMSIVMGRTAYVLHI